MRTSRQQSGQPSIAPLPNGKRGAVMGYGGRCDDDDCRRESFRQRRSRKAVALDVCEDEVADIMDDAELLEFLKRLRGDDPEPSP